MKFKVRDLLSGVIMMTALYTINMLIAGTNNLPIFSNENIFKNQWLEGIFHGEIPSWMKLVVILIIVLAAKFLLDFFLNTQSGYLLRAVGDNDVLVTALAKDKGNVKILGLAIANGLVSLSGCVFCQDQKVFEISSGTGALVLGLASVIIGISLLKGLTFIKATTAVLIGSIIYKACVAIAIRNFEPVFMKLITAVLFLIILILSMERKKKVKGNA